MAVKKRRHWIKNLDHTKPKMRDVSYLKPENFKDHLTIFELARAVQKDASWLRKLEAADRIPKAARVSSGKLSVRLWSPAQVQEIKEILSKIKVGRPRK